MSVQATNYVFRACHFEDVTCRAVLGALAWRSKPETPHLAYMRHVDLMEDSGLRSENGLKAALRRLEAAGEIRVVQVGGRVAGFGAMACEYELVNVSAWIEAGEPDRHAWKVSVCERKVSVYDGKVSVCAGKVSDYAKKRPLTDTHRQDNKDTKKTPPPVASLPPAPQPTSPPKKRRERKPHPVLRHDLDDEAWLAHVKTLPQYAHVNWDNLLERCIAWCAKEGNGSPTRMRLKVWADKQEKPLTIGTKRKDEAAERRRRKMLEEELEMKRAFAAAQEAA